MTPTKLDVFNEWQFDCDVPRLMKEIIQCSGAKVYASVWNVFTALITQVAVRATEIHDPVLDALMLRMGLYDIDPHDRRFFVNECKKLYEKGGKE